MPNQCHVYVIELEREVLGEAKFAARSPDHRDNKPCARPIAAHGSVGGRLR